MCVCVCVIYIYYSLFIVLCGKSFFQRSTKSYERFQNSDKKHDKVDSNRLSWTRYRRLRAETSFRYLPIWPTYCVPHPLIYLIIISKFWNFRIKILLQSIIIQYFFLYTLWSTVCINSHLHAFIQISMRKKKCFFIALKDPT